MANCFRKIVFRFSITKGKWPLPVQEDLHHMRKNGCQKRILHPKNLGNSHFWRKRNSIFFSVDQCNLTVVQFRYDDLEERVISFSWDKGKADVFSAVAGMLGLMCGMSFLFFIEIIHALLLTIYEKIYAIHHKK